MHDYFTACRGATSRLESSKRRGLLLASQGLELRHQGGDEEVEPVPEVAGKRKLNVTTLEEMRHLFAFPSDAFEVVEAELAFAREGSC